MSTDDVVRKLTTIMAADVVGYSRLMSEDEENTLRTFRNYRKIIDGLIEKHRGRIFNTAGDAVLAEFDSAVECVRCAISIQEELSTRNAQLPDDKQIKLRIGINVGDVMIEGEDLFGDGVNIAARLEGLAQPGSICISANTFEQVKDKLSIGFEDLGPQEVKNIGHPVGAFRIMPGPVSIAPGRKAQGKRKILGRRTIASLTAAAFLLILFAGFMAWREASTPPVSLSTLPANFSTDSLKAEQIGELMPGFIIQGTAKKTGGPFTIRVLADGVAEFEVERVGSMAGTFYRETGKWWVENYKYCMQFSRFANGQQLCPRLVREDDRLSLTHPDGVPIKWTIRRDQ